MAKPPFHDLGSYLAALGEAGELARVACEVDPEYEITQIVQEVVRRPGGGPALLFERVKGSRYPLAVNLLGSLRRIEIAFGRHPEEIGREFQRLGERLMPPTLGGILSEWRALARFRFMRPRRVGSPGLEEVAGGFAEMPVLKCWPGDAGRFLTFGLVVSANPRNRKQNLGVYRMQVLGPREVAMHWQIQKGGAAHAEATPGPIPVAIAVGADPATMFAAVCPLPEDVDELHFAGLLRGASTRLARGETVPLDLPAEAEFLIEGRVDPARTVPEGPFGDHFGRPQPLRQFSNRRGIAR
ncbi:MAG: UbiD family decarboxylase domain-containing protein, partial [bacterium]